MILTVLGPDFWGLVDKRWHMCSKGKIQSPINIDPSALLYDPNLREFHIDKKSVNFFFVKKICKIFVCKNKMFAKFIQTGNSL